MLSYFACEQAQMQRYLTGRSADEGRRSLLLSAYVSNPLQLLVLGTGVLVFVYYLFQPPPMLFNHEYDARVAAGPHAAAYAGLERQFQTEVAARREAASRNDRDAFLASDARVQDIRAHAVGIVKD